MALIPGTRLGPYEVTGQLGAGGMGEVYRATDTVLKRQVALKVLPPDVAGNPERVARFQREAEVLASLNHPNIAHLYGIERSDGTLALVMELVEGPTLADRIAQRPIPLDEALPIARQIAEALEAAHELGIIHRDLKPANIKVRDDGTVKVLDFGLAKALEPVSGLVPAASALTNSPTITSPALMTGVGVLLGTAAYMSPEQAKGRPADKRSDIWAFGCVLYEMLCAKRAFGGDDVAETLAAVIRAEPALSDLPPRIPPSIVRLLGRCLVKDSRRRLADVADAQFELADDIGLVEQSEVKATRFAGTWVPHFIWAAVAITVAVGAGVYSRSTGRVSQPRDIFRFAIFPPTDGSFAGDVRAPGMIALSPDGHRLAFIASVRNRPAQLWVRALDGVDATPISGTENAIYPFWSPDGREIAFAQNGSVRRVSLGANGPPATVCSGLTIAGHGAWASDGTMLLTTFGGIMRVSATGGTPTPVIPNQTAGANRFPALLPDGNHFLYTDTATHKAYVADLSGDTPKELGSSDSQVLYASNYLLFASGNTLFAQAFDPARRALIGEPTPVESGVVGTLRGDAQLAVGGRVLAYVTGSTFISNQLTWVDRRGQVIGTVGDPAAYTGVALTPDERRIFAHRHEGANGGNIWVIDVARQTSSRFTTDTSIHDSAAHVSPDGQKVVFSSTRVRGSGNQLFVTDIDGSKVTPLLDTNSPQKGPLSWSPDGRYIVFQEDTATARDDLWVVSAQGDGKAFPFLATQYNESEGVISPDGRWMAYTSDESGEFEVYVRAFPSATGKQQISAHGGRKPQWRADGKELFFVSSARDMMSVDVTSRPDELSISTPRALFSTNVLDAASLGGGGAQFVSQTYVASHDGSRFLIVSPASGQPVTPITVTIGWDATLHRKE